MVFYSPSQNAFYLPALATPPNDAVAITQARHRGLMDGQAAGQRIVADAEGLPILAGPSTTQPTLDDARRERDRRIAAGCSVSVTGLEEPVPITGRPADRDNLSGLAVVALARLGASDTTPIRFRDGDDTIHTLTPTQMMEVIAGGAAHIEACYAVVWAWADGGSVPADFADDAHWP